MKTLICLFYLVLFLISKHSLAQDEWVQYAVFFTDKNYSQYSIHKPNEFLSQRAINRRKRFHIPITETDLPVSDSYLIQIAQFGINTHQTSKWLNALLIKVPIQFNIEVIKTLPFVKKVEKVFDSSINQNKITNKFLLEGELSTSFDYGLSENQIKMINADALHDMGYRGEGMVIAILDAGFNNTQNVPGLAHLFSENRILGVKDFVANDGSVFEDHQHGTNVLSVMAANLPGQIVGSAPMASFWLIRTEDAASESLAEEFNWVLGAEFADSVGADVINSSLGYTTFDNSLDDHTYQDLDGNTTVITKGANTAASKGILVVNSAGNSGSDPWHYIGAPADGHSVLAIGAVDANGEVAAFSSRGPSYDGRVKPDVCGQGNGTTLLSPTGAVSLGSGTSFSSPLIAGISACLWQAFPDSSNFKIMEAIKISAHKYSNPDADYGYGIPNFYRAFLYLAGISLSDYSKDQLFSVGPNPFTDKTMLGFYSVNAQNITIKITDVSGKTIAMYSKKMARGGVELIPVNYSNQLQSAGIYLLTVFANNGKYSLKLMKQ
ncbi:MAG: S8 family serine peptidase [Bacteroidetes bacterium]|nr:T9SS C-terminal target domain-containing protein [Bacteroidota bacterium]MBV6459948.1 hypothetical protein [Flavobacteriales bacterium]WKZ76407.1 MAG: S8 family serine peptidase [Vicingaceae bacterium]MCL4816328.1 S8 family serine peptidase [Flavobacteriales bacterium]NOG95344.1 S8 family serine peptidase [Bacteroidota bacterium]